MGTGLSPSRFAAILLSPLRGSIILRLYTHGLRRGLYSDAATRLNHCTRGSHSQTSLNGGTPSPSFIRPYGSTLYMVVMPISMCSSMWQ
jgi:hypothetical protein